MAKYGRTTSGQTTYSTLSRLYPMPFKSKAQQRFLHAHPEKVGGAAKLKEWDAATDFSSLPQKKSLAKSAKKVLKHG